MSYQSRGGCDCAKASIDARVVSTTDAEHKNDTMHPAAGPLRPQIIEGHHHHHEEHKRHSRERHNHDHKDVKDHKAKKESKEEKKKEVKHDVEVKINHVDSKIVHYDNVPQFRPYGNPCVCRPCDMPITAGALQYAYESIICDWKLSHPPPGQAPPEQALFIKGLLYQWFGYRPLPPEIVREFWDDEASRFVPFIGSISNKMSDNKTVLMLPPPCDPREHDDEKRPGPTGPTGQTGPFNLERDCHCRKENDCKHEEKRPGPCGPCGKEAKKNGALLRYCAVSACKTPEKFVIYPLGYRAPYTALKMPRERTTVMIHAVYDDCPCCHHLHHEGKDHGTSGQTGPRREEKKCDPCAYLRESKACCCEDKSPYIRLEQFPGVLDRVCCPPCEKKCPPVVTKPDECLPCVECPGRERKHEEKKFPEVKEEKKEEKKELYKCPCNCAKCILVVDGVWELQEVPARWPYCGPVVRTPALVLLSNTLRTPCGREVKEGFELFRKHPCLKLRFSVHETCFEFECPECHYECEAPDNCKWKAHHLLDEAKELQTIVTGLVARATTDITTITQQAAMATTAYNSAVAEYNSTSTLLTSHVPALTALTVIPPLPTTLPAVNNYATVVGLLPLLNTIITDINGAFAANNMTQADFTQATAIMAEITNIVTQIDVEMKDITDLEAKAVNARCEEVACELARRIEHELCEIRCGMNKIRELLERLNFLLVQASSHAGTVSQFYQNMVTTYQAINTLFNPI